MYTKQKIQNIYQGQSHGNLRDYGIGETPMERITFIIQGVPRTIHLKLEGCNPTHSMKDRTAYGLVKNMEEEGGIQKNATVIESTSGNLGVALARLCEMKGYHFIAVIDPKTTQENLQKMRKFGATIEYVEKPDSCGGYLLSRLERVQQLQKHDTHIVWTNQYQNTANPLIHYHSTGPEIYRQMQHQVDAIFVPVSTGGTLSGIGRFFREIQQPTQIIGVDVHGSIIFGTPPGTRKLTGIGSSRKSSFIHPGLYDGHMLVSDEQAMALCHAIYRSTHLHIGGSSGAAVAACARYLAAYPSCKNVVCVCADHGKNYASSIYSAQWLKQQGITIDADNIWPIEAILPGQ